MTVEQAEEAIGNVVLSRSPVSGEDGPIAWTVDRRPRSAELRVFTEALERGGRARTFDDFVATKARAVVTFRGGVLISIDPPAGQSAGLNWP
jgi:hypothetical protein